MTPNAILRFLTAGTLAAALALSVGAQTKPRPVPSKPALALRDEGLAELENERPQEAEAIYRRLIEVLPSDPLGYANLGVALLRQQRYDEALEAIGQALEKAPGRGDLLALRGDVLQWQGDPDAALTAYQKAAAAAPADVEVLYALYQHASNTGHEKDALEALTALASQRPDNVVVLLGLAEQAVAAGDRAAASRALLRLEELVWQGSELAGRALGMVRTALEKDDVATARVPVQRLENVLKVSPMFRQSLRELRTGILGISVQHFADEAPPKDFGRPLRVRFAGKRLDRVATLGGALAIGDFDGDRKADLARVRAATATQPVMLEVRLGKGGHAVSFTAAAREAEALLAVDIDNDGHLDLALVGAKGAETFKGDGAGGFTDTDFGIGDADGRAIAAIDFDIEGDLDLAIGGKTVEIFRNNLAGPLEAVGVRVLGDAAPRNVNALVASDLDRDGDLDLAVAHNGGVAWLDNLRQGRMVSRTAEGGLAAAQRARDVVSADLDNDGLPDLITAGRGLGAWHNRGGRFSPWTLLGLPQDGEINDLIAFDADNDGRLDLAAAGPGGVVVYAQAARGRFARSRIEGGPESAGAVLARDLDDDGDLDLVVAGAGGLHTLINQDGNANQHLAVRLRGLAKGNSKNNVFGIGSVIEVRDGGARQVHEVSSDIVHLGLGDRKTAAVLRIVWTNGVPQNRLAVAADQTIVEEQLLKGSCPFLYAFDGESFRFVTDLLWGAPIGLPVAPGIYADSDPGELVRIDGAWITADGRLELRITEELWEAAFFDHVRLWVVDHPEDVAVASNLRIVPGRAQVGERVLAMRGLRPMATATDGEGLDVTAAVRQRDEVYADGYSLSPYQGVAARPWHFTFDLGEAPEAPVRLWLDGWIFPADASLNLAVAQRRDLEILPPRLEVATNAGWQTLMPSMGFPAGKTKTMVIDTPPLPAGARRLRIVTTQWLHWDRLAWSTQPADDAPVIVTQPLPIEAELQFRGFSTPVRQAPNAPHHFDYDQVSTESPWLPFPGRYTRYGDVRELLELADDRSVIMAPGDEIRLVFDLASLPLPAPGQLRTLFLESHGWDKDADRNTGAGERMEPLPFRAMRSYPYGPEELFPDTPANRHYRDQWLTRVVGQE